MPGISLIYSCTSSLNARKTDILQALDNTIHDQRFSREILCETVSCIMGYVAYAEYPVAHFDDNNFIVTLEGRIYNQTLPEIQRVLLNFAQAVFLRQESIKQDLTDWLLKTDGDFVVYMMHRATGDCMIFNDILGRLPVYYAQESTNLFVARDLRFITNLLPVVAFDRIGIAQYLLIGYSLGEKTFCENIHRLQPANLVRLSPAGIKLTPLYSFDFESKTHSNNSVDQNARELVSRFDEACKDRSLDGYTNVLSMSGGLDSRAVGAGFNRNQIPFVGATFLDFEKAAQSDAVIAERLAKALHVPWKLFELGGIKGRDVRQLLLLKNGLSPLMLSVILPFFGDIRETWGAKSYYVTGDGGDKALPDLRPPRHLRSMDDLMRFTISRHHFFTLEQVATITNLSKQAIRDSFRDRFESYPEKSPDYQYVHLYIYERAFKWLFESEDRNRCYFWSVTPFYGIEFFKYAMNCPDNQKSLRHLYAQFLNLLSAEIMAIKDQNTGQMINSWKYRNKTRIKNTLIGIVTQSETTAHIAQRLSGKIDAYASNAPILECLSNQLSNCMLIGDILSTTAIRSVIENNDTYSKTCIQHLLTVTSAIENLGTRQCSIDRFLDINLI
jgi:asparagine synthase (glutamine-hydrolysing)